MSYEKMTGAIDLEELEVQAEEVAEAAAAIWSSAQWIGLDRCLCYFFG